MSLHVHAPVRIDFAGGWSDDLQFSEIGGGRVVNAAIALQVDVDFLTGDKTIRLHDEDQREHVTVTSPAQLSYNGELDRHKAALYRLYNRELRRNPTLQGQMVLRIRIEPDGSVSLCELQGTDMDAPNLSAQVLDRVRTFDFGAKEVPAVTILYPIDFLPAV